MPPNQPPASPLSVLGFTAEREELYRVLLRNSGCTLAELATMVGMDWEQLADELAPVVAAGLAEVRGDVVVAHPPDKALGRLISDETRRLQSVEAQLEALRGLMPSLAAEHLSARAPKGDPVALEMVHGTDVVDLIRSITSTSPGDLLWLRPDQWRYPDGHAADLWVRSLVSRGRRSRAIYPARVLEEAPDVIRERARAGEHVRILAEVPTRLAVLGDAAALLPQEFGLRSDRVLVVRQEAMIGSLRLLFDSLWDRAMAVPGLDGQPYDESASERRLLLDQLARGARDEQIARALGLSLRTVRRRLAGLLDELGADSRFQAGVEAVRRGWI